ncbi:MAG: thioesterase family protein [Pseudomonadota bacterium]
MNIQQETKQLMVGLCHSEKLRVEVRHTVPEVDTTWPGFKDMPPVLATAMMIAFIEETCIMGLRPHLASGQGTVGTHVDVSHVAATPVGMSITAEVELIEAKGKSLLFRVSCRDDAGLIGEGIHRRAIIDVARFNQRVREKSN